MGDLLEIRDVRHMFIKMQNGRELPNAYWDERRKLERLEHNLRSTKLYWDIVEVIMSDDINDVLSFRQTLAQSAERLKQEAEEYNAAFDEVVHNFIPSAQRSRFFRQIRKAPDPDSIERFDLLVQYVRDNAHVRGVLIQEDDSTEAALFEILKSGKKRIPTVNSPEVWRDAAEQFGPGKKTEIQRRMF